MDTHNNIDKVIANEKNLQLLINHIDEPIWFVDKTCTIIECNKSFKKWVACFIGCELQEGDHVLFNGQNRIYAEKFESCYQLAFKGESFRSVEDMNVNGEIRYTAVSFNPVFDAEHNAIGVSCFARDITEQRKHLRKIEEQNTALREIAFIESHRVRGPVATILGLTQLFNNEDTADPVNMQLIEGIQKVTLQLDEIVREVVRKSNEIGP
jgi:PAS domain S-box-containing protein